MLNLDSLRLFQAVSDHSSVKSAAARLGITPSAVSQGLKKLEENLGFQLYLREHKRIVLSPEGNRFRERVLPHLRELDDAIQHGPGADGAVGELVIGVPVEIGSTIVVPKFAAFRVRHPRVRARLVFGSPWFLLDGVRGGALDFALVTDGEHFRQLPPALSRKRVFEEELAMVVPRTLLQGKKSAPSYADLITLPHLDFTPEAHVALRWYQHHFQRKPRRLEVAMTAENAWALFEGVKCGVGVAVLPAERLPEEAGDHLVLRPGKRPLVNSIILLQHQDKRPTAVEKLFLEFILDW